MSCREMNALMSPYLDGLLDGAQTRRLEHHVDGCEDCRYKMELMQEIPQALQTDRMLAPRPEFTAMVMQRIVISAQLQSEGGVQTRVRAEFRSETQYTFRSPEAPESGSPESNPKNEAKILTLPRRAPVAPAPAKSPNVYVLRFASMAAALVMAVSVGIYALQINDGTSSNLSANNTTAAIGTFARTLTDAFQSPAELVLGVVIAIGVVVCLSYLFLRNTNGSFNQNRDLE